MSLPDNYPIQCSPIIRCKDPIATATGSDFVILKLLEGVFLKHRSEGNLAE